MLNRLEDREKLILILGISIVIVLLLSSLFKSAYDYRKDLEMEVNESRGNFTTLDKAILDYNYYRSLKSGDGENGSSMISKVEIIAQKYGFKERIISFKDSETNILKDYYKTTLDVQIRSVRLQDVIKLIYDIEVNKQINCKVDYINFRKPIQGKDEYDVNMKMSSYSKFGKKMSENPSEIETSDPIEDLENQDQNEDFDLEVLEGGLSLKNKIILILCGLFFLIFFIVALFPIEEILRAFLSARTEKAGIHIGFKKLNFPYFGIKTIDSLYILTKENVEFRAEEVNFSLNPYQIYNKSQVVTKIESYSNQFEMSSFQMNTRNINLDLDLTNTDRESLLLNGTIGIVISGGNITRLPDVVNFLGLREIKVKTVQMNLKVTGKKILIEKANFDLSIAKISIKGRIDIAPVFTNSLIDLELCPKLSKEFASEREDLQNTLLLFSKEVDPCFPLKGTFGNPRFDMNIPAPQSTSQESPPSELGDVNTPKPISPPNPANNRAEDQ